MSTIAPSTLEAGTRRAIADVVARLSRGVDRHDRELMESCYHPDATDDHGVYKGSAAGFIDWVLGATAGIPFMQHAITNHVIIAVGDGVIGTETMYHVRTHGADGQLAQAFGRYLDHFELRNGEWRIADRLCTMEFTTANLGYDLSVFDNGSPDAEDCSYRLIRTVTGA